MTDRVSRAWLTKVGCTAAAMAALVVAACSHQPAHADTRIGVHVGSHHFSGTFNNVNPGLYLFKDGWTVGTYYNSERRQSYYAGYTFEGDLIGAVDYGVTVGLITGYQRARVLPMLVPSVSAVNPLLGGRTRLSFVPPVGKGSAAAVHLSHEWSF